MDEKKEEMVTLKLCVKDAIEMFNFMFWLTKKESEGYVNILSDSEFQAMLDFLKVLFDELNKKTLVEESTEGDFKACQN